MPFFPLGVKSFKIKFIFMKSTYPYLGVFLKYMIVRFLLNNRFGRSLRKIKYPMVSINNHDELVYLFEQCDSLLYQIAQTNNLYYININKKGRK